MCEEGRSPSDHVDFEGWNVQERTTFDTEMPAVEDVQCALKETVRKPTIALISASRKSWSFGTIVLTPIGIFIDGLCRN